MAMAKNEITLKLSKQEALVFFEWLADVIEPMEKTIYKYPAEEKVVWKLQAQLESTLAEPFLPNYGEIVDEARRSVGSNCSAGLR